MDGYFFHSYVVLSHADIGKLFLLQVSGNLSCAGWTLGQLVLSYAGQVLGKLVLSCAGQVLGKLVLSYAGQVLGELVLCRAGVGETSLVQGRCWGN